MPGARGGHDRFRFFYVLIAMVAFLLLSSLVSEKLIWDDVAFLAVVLATLRATAGRRGMFFSIVALGVVALAGRGSGVFLPPAVAETLALAASILFLSGATLLVLRDVLDEKKFTDDKLFGALCAYLLIGITWALLYNLVWTFDPAAFSIPEPPGTESSVLIYFSFVTLTTLGYGDVTPVSAIARTLAWMEAATGQFFLAMLVAHLVGLRFILRTPPGGRDRPVA